MDEILNLAGEIKNTLSNGPGEMRYAIFAQGCPHHCQDCHNKHTWDFKNNFLISVDDMFNKIKKEIPIIKGVTFSGGEPFCQAKDFLLLAKKIKQETNLNICCYTGYTYKEIKQLEILRSEECQNKIRLLEYIDILIDGKFDINLTKGNHPYVGSSNQNILYLKKGEIINE